MAGPSTLRERVFRMVADGELDAEAAMRLLRRLSDLDPAPARRDDPQGQTVAVIGMAGRFGSAPDLDAYWRLIEAGDSCLAEMPDRRWPQVPGRRRRGGFLPDEDRFDPLFFRISPTEAALMDPQQRLFLETAYHAIEDAGYAPSSLAGARCGVFAGAGAGDYAQRFRDAGLESNPLGLMGNVASILAARISYFLDLKGPSVALDTACSSSLVAVHLACESLLAGTSDMALAGGVAVISTPQFLGAMTEGGMLSPNDRCATFDAAADGFACGEGSGVVVLKRLADAVRDGDAIRGVIRGSGINQDGRTNGITAPSAPSQASLEIEVYRRAGIDPATISYVEAHGTGTPLGDPIEVEALTSAFRRFTDRTGFCALGSAKTTIGHALTAAGIAGLLKLLLMLRHRRIPPLGGFTEANPRIDFPATPFTVPTTASDWNAPGLRRAAISSFGFSGTNAHLVIEEAPASPDRAPAEGPHLFLLSGRTEEARRERALQLAATLAGTPTDLRDLAHTLAAGRDHHAHRLAVVADDVAALRAALTAWAEGGRDDPSVLSGEATPAGPGPALTAFGERLAREDESDRTLRVLADLYCQGAAFDWGAVAGADGGRRCALPGYPFERMSCTIPAGSAAATAQPSDAFAELDRAMASQAAPDLAGQAASFQAVEAWGRRSMAAAYQAMGLLERRVYTVAGLRKALGIVPAKQRLHDALVDMLEREGVLAREGDLLRTNAEAGVTCDLAAEKARLAEAEPELAPFLVLLERCVDHLAQVLRGHMTATEVMFPDGRMDLVEPIYRGSRLAEHFNGLLAQGVRTLAARLGRPARILEIGAGTGGATVGILNAFADRGAIAEYHYTDVSRGFVQQGRERFGSAGEVMRFAVLDIERDPLEQGFALGSFDLVVASNVLHASRSIARAAGHVAALTAENGYALLNEVTALQDYATLTFGLTDGWWAFDDAEARMANAPLLDVPKWRRVLDAAGFGAVAAFGLPGEAREAASQSVLIAQRAGTAAVRAPDGAAVRARVEPDASPAPVTSGDGLAALVAREVAAALGLPAERVDARGRFMDLGIDSIMGGQVVARLNAALGLSLRPTVLFDHPSVEDLARFIAREHGAQLRVPPPARSDDPAPAPAPQATTPDVRPRDGGDGGVVDRRIAVIGMAARFADCPDISAFHAMLAEGRSGITEVPSDRWSAESASLPDDVRSEAAYLRWGGFLKDAADFDPLFFRISGKEAELTDPQHRVFLTEAWRALEDAGYAERELDGRRCGVFVGAYGGDYTHRMTDLGIAPEAFAFMGNAASILAARIAYVLNLKGPSMAVDTACSSSLTAVHLACRSLLDGECDMALAGGVFLTTTMGFNTAAAKAGMLSPAGACKTFDADADGFVPGEGAGVVVLKPYEKAVADGDRIDAVILASAVNQDGKTNGITAPSPESQAALETEVYQAAGINPDSITYVEAHGTGTKLGDPIEIEGLTRAFRRWTDRTGFCAVGSVKTNIGHAAHAAGIAGLLKVVLSLRHRMVFPSRNFTRENPELRLSETPFVVSTELRPWHSDGLPRRAAVSSFGFSGTNVHMLLAEAEPALPRAAPSGPQLITLSARSEAALQRRKADLRAWLQANAADLRDLAFTLNGGRCVFEHRWAAIVETPGELVSALADPAASGSHGDPAAGRRPDLTAAAEAYRRSGEIAAAALPADGRRIALPSYPFEMQRYWLDRIEPARPPATSVPPATYLAPEWTAEPLASADLPDGPLWLLPDAGGIGARLAATWQGAGRAVVALRPSDLADVAGLRQRHGAPAAILHLADLDGPEPWDPDRLDADLQGGMKVIAALVRPLFADPVRVLYAHRGRPVQEIVWALRRSLQFDGAALDLRTLALAGPLPSPDDAAAHIIAEIGAAPSQAEEAVLRGGRRHVRRMTLLAAPTDATPALPRGGHFVLTGGGGALAGLFARRLAEATGGRITLLGRSPATEAVRATLDAVGAGLYRQVDVTDAAALARVLDEARSAHGPITGVLHMAGVPGGPLLREADWADIEACLAPKVAGTVALDRALGNEPLAFFVLFSSLASELGDFGQGGYAAANAFCDRFAAWREAARSAGRRQGRTIALDWPLWREGRPVLSAEGESIYLATAGLPYLETETGWQAFLDALVLAAPQVAVLPTERGAALALIRNHDVAAPRRPGRVAGSAPADHAAAAIPAGERVNAVRQELTGLIAGLLKLDAGRLAPGAGLADFGFDSIALKEFAVRIGETYDIAISPAVFFARGTIDALADHLAATYPDAVARRHAKEAAVETPVPVQAQEEPRGHADRPRRRDDAIAVIGMSGRFPGSSDLGAFWRHLEAGSDLVSGLPQGRELAAQAPYDRDAIRGGFLDTIDRFDAAFFRISPREACFLDPQHRLAIEAVWHCVEDAGVRMSDLVGKPVGVFFGPQVNEYGAIVPDRDVARAQIALGNIATMLPNRVSYLFDLRGPSEAVDTACSSSLVAVHRAIQALRAGECDMALAGGVSLVLTAESIVSTEELGVMSPDGRCHSFDARANGYVKGEGVGVVLLKPLDRALADGDPVHAVILGSAANHGGHGHSLTSPNGTAQAALITAALRNAGVASDTIGYVEAHGTGTELGDPVEIMALKEAFAATSASDAVEGRACGIGTVKTNIGHLEPASGIAGLIKTVLALRHRTLPASLHFQKLNPLIDFGGTAFSVVDRTRPWQPLRDRRGNKVPRRAGVSSFGLGGSNVHVVLEEYATDAPSAVEPRPELLLVSARDPERLKIQLRRLAACVREQPGLAVADVAHTLAVGRDMMDVRAALVWRPGHSLADRLEAAAQVTADGDDLWFGSVSASLLGRPDRTADRDVTAGPRADGGLERLAALWVVGGSLPAGVTRGRRVGLPGYPFAPTRHWHDRVPGAVRPQESPAPIAAAPTVQPAVAPVPVSRSVDEVRGAVRRLLAQALYLEEAQLDDRAGFVDLGLDSILAVELTKALNDELGTTLQATRLYDYRNVADLAEHLAGGGVDAPPSPIPSAGMPSHPSGAAIASVSRSADEVRGAVRRLLAQALYLEEAQLDDRAGFVDLGLDSILAVELTKALNDELGTTLQATRLYDYRNVADLAAHLHASLRPLASDGAQDPMASPEGQALKAHLGAVGAVNLTAATPLASIALQPVQAKTILSDLNARFACGLTESDVGRCDDLGALAALIVARSSGGTPPAVAAPCAELALAGGTMPAHEPVGFTDHPVLAEPVKPRAVDAREASARTPVMATDRPDVAIIGYACRLPGAADAAAYWDLMCRGDSAVTAYPGEAWRREAFQAVLDALGLQTTPWGGYLTDVDRFDPAFFNISRDQAKAMDPQQRLFLQVAWHALEMAGLTRSMLDGADCGVFVGGGTSDYGRILEAQGAPVGGETLLGNIASILAARIAYFLNLRGPCIAMDTACSSGLVALHTAWRSIREGTCGSAIVGGVNLLLTPQMHTLTSAGGMLSATGACRTFDDDADGFVPAEGIVALVLKRLDRAQADGDPIQGIISGAAVNQNGTTAGIAAPSARAQARLLDRLYREHGIDPGSIGLIEVHGTGTRIGDAVEFDALCQAFAAAGGDGTRLTSAKPAIGHTFAASGLAGVVKLLQAMRHGRIPPMRAPQRLNTHMRVDGSPFVPAFASEPWPPGPSGRRRAAATSYGLSGTNAHVVLTEASPADPAGAAPARDRHLVVLSGRDGPALQRQIEALRDAVAHRPAPLADIAYTLSARRTHFSTRAAFVVRDIDDLSAQLAHWPDSGPDDAPGPLRDMALSYVAGHDPDWASLYPHGRVCDLPGYRFAAERCWPGAEPPSGDVIAPQRGQCDDNGLEVLRAIVAKVVRTDASRIDPDVPFDVLGLDSSAALAIMQNAQQAFGVLLPTIALWDHPTLRRLAAFIEAQPRYGTDALASPAQAARHADGTHDPVVPVRAGAGQPMFWVHGGTGDVHWVSELARHLPDDRPVYGLEAAGLDGFEAPPTSVEAMAEHYVEGVLRTQPEGPYWLGGYSAGGAIAFEMARRMARMGRPVERLILLDAAAPGNTAVAEMQNAYGPGYVYLVVGNWLGSRWGMTRQLVLADLQDGDKAAMLERVVDHLFAHANPPVDRAIVRRHLEAYDRVGWSIGTALRNYEPQPLDRPVDLFLFECRKGMAGGSNPLGLPAHAGTESYRDGWDALVPTPVVRIGLECDHFGLFKGDVGRELGERMIAPGIDGEAGSTGRKPIEDVVIGLVRDILPDVPAEAVTVDRSMSELGATSIDRVEVATLAMETLGLAVPNRELAEVGTIDQLIDVLHRHASRG
ncbi:SDR family NAD(P)-dependent oxidoreductase [Marinivivus vitaminiproducens]|uniref:SDR family NAD(P)-dependent oxidoreductase n=1 Tax=Marinivivus vitaminiproducens TaxID=3035935 RepID=UPI0027A8ED29|nr:SDR family NAD(P)-dependent oxidoreductase [Geminicoccaceae bacterium SCSIO 64248]